MHYFHLKMCLAAELRPDPLEEELTALPRPFYCWI